MRVDVVVILEPGRQLLEDRDGVWPWVHAGIVTFQGFDECLANAIALRAADWREAWNKVKRSSKISGLSGGIGGAIISQPLDGKRGAERVEPALHAVEHHVADHLTGNAAAMGRDPGDDFAVMGVDREGDAKHLAVPIRYLKAIGRQAPIGGSRDDAALMSANGAPPLETAGLG
jgi:hypothetical protein